MDSKDFLKNKNLRKQELDEIIVDLDDRTDKGYLCYAQTCFNLINANYHIQSWFADGMKCPHIHIRKIVGLGDLTKEEGTKYRKLFFQKYIPKEYWRKEKLSDDEGEIPDYSMANPYEDAYHPIAQENQTHHKYNTLKLMTNEFNLGEINQIELDLLDRVTAIDPEQKPIRLRSDSGGECLYEKIAARISINGMADQFGLLPLGKKLRVCPFHADSAPSLSLNEKGLFNCFGCSVSGNIIVFYAMLKRLNPSFEIKVVK